MFFATKTLYIEEVLPMNYYSRITKQERCLIEMGVRSGKSRRSIAVRIGRPPKTVSEEIRRNGGYLGYYSAQAHYERNKSNRAGHSKIDSNLRLAGYIRDKLGLGWSPEVIAGRWKKENDVHGISHESIYTWVYRQAGDLYMQLPRKKKKRGLRPQRSSSLIPNRTSIHQRPEVINNRSEMGHFEGDLIFQQGNLSQNILAVIERKSRMLILKKNESKHSEKIMDKLRDIRSKYPMKTITFDNGSEFSSHSKLGIDTYFCDPASPWQKGAIEHANGIVRRYIDYRIDINKIDQKMLDFVANLINNKPRKILGFLTPNEAAASLFREKLEGVTF